MPFYDGHDEDVIPVYYPSDLFQGFFVQAYQHLKKFNFDSWFVVADDMIINPNLNEKNINKTLKVGYKDSFIPKLNSFSPKLKWPHAHKALRFKLNPYYVEIKNYLPTIEYAYQKLLSLKLEPHGFLVDNVYWKRDGETEHHLLARYGIQYLKDSYKDKKKLLHPEYPFCRGYSDIFCIGKDNIRDFCHFCGVFAAAGLFVEIALPTALVLATKGKLTMQTEIEYRGKALWGGKAIGDMLNPFNFDLHKLIINFPNKHLFLHPVKLSQWEMAI